jgi:hypothetical protein
MPITYLDPIPESSTPSDPYTLSVDASRPVRIGLVANSFPGSARFLSFVADAVGRELDASFVSFEKDKLGLNASIMLPDDQVTGIRAEVDAVVTAYGH